MSLRSSPRVLLLDDHPTVEDFVRPLQARGLIVTVAHHIAHADNEGVYAEGVYWRGMPALFNERIAWEDFDLFILDGLLLGSPTQPAQIIELIARKKAILNLEARIFAFGPEPFSRTVMRGLGAIDEVQSKSISHLIELLARHGLLDAA